MSSVEDKRAKLSYIKFKDNNYSKDDIIELREKFMKIKYDLYGYKGVPCSFDAIFNGEKLTALIILMSESKKLEYIGIDMKSYFLECELNVEIDEIKAISLNTKLANISYEINEKNLGTDLVNLLKKEMGSKDAKIREQIKKCFNVVEEELEDDKLSTTAVLSREINY